MEATGFVIVMKNSVQEQICRYYQTFLCDLFSWNSMHKKEWYPQKNVLGYILSHILVLLSTCYKCSQPTSIWHSSFKNPKNFDNTLLYTFFLLFSFFLSYFINYMIKRISQDTQFYNFLAEKKFHDVLAQFCSLSLHVCRFCVIDQIFISKIISTYLLDSSTEFSHLVTFFSRFQKMSKPRWRRWSTMTSWKHTIYWSVANLRNL